MAKKISGNLGKSVTEKNYLNNQVKVPQKRALVSFKNIRQDQKKNID